MKKLIYSSESLLKIKDIESYLTENYGLQSARNIKRYLKSRIQSLKEYPYQGASLRDIYGFETDFRHLFVPPTHVIYTVSNDRIEIINLYHEREDFISKLFSS